jgi:hypothetical protein
LKSNKTKGYDHGTYISGVSMYRLSNTVVRMPLIIPKNNPFMIRPLNIVAFSGFYLELPVILPELLLSHNTPP